MNASCICDCMLLAWEIPSKKNRRKANMYEQNRVRKHVPLQSSAFVATETTTTTTPATAKNTRWRLSMQNDIDSDSEACFLRLNRKFQFSYISMNSRFRFVCVVSDFFSQNEWVTLEHTSQRTHRAAVRAAERCFEIRMHFKQIVRWLSHSSIVNKWRKTHAIVWFMQMRRK